MKAYFDLPAPRVFAHRGLALEAPENTLLAFAQAIAIGVHYIETDVNASADGHAIVSHDPDLRRLLARPERIGALTRAELGDIDLGEGQAFPTLAEALHAFPETRFNIDVKDPLAVAPTIRAIVDAKARDRVLVTSFDERRRAAVVAGLPGVATSASARRVALAVAAAKAGSVAGVRRALRGVDCVQIPTRAGRFSTTTPRFIDTLHAAGVEVHHWTINDPDEMTRLLDRGVDGLVTDRADLAVPQARRYSIPSNPL